MSVRKSIFIMVLVAWILPISAYAETLSGHVLDPQGKSISGAQVRLFDRKSGELRSAKSNDDGAYTFQGLPKGDYLLEADSSTATLSFSHPVSISSDQKLDLKLEISGTKSDVLVIASATPLNVDEIAKAVDVIDSEEIARRDEISIADALRSLPGLRVQTLEGPGSLTSIQMRGLQSQDTAVLIDGMRFRDASSLQGDASAFFEDMNLIDTERIEVLRGSGSSLYGSHALGGVINITSRPGGGPRHGQFLIEGGGLGMVRSVANIGGEFKFRKKPLSYSLGASTMNVARGPRNGLPYRNYGTQGSAKYTVNDKISLTGRLWYSNSYLASTVSPAFNADILANSADTGNVKAVALPLDQLKLYETGQPFNAGNATFIPNQIDPDARRLGWFLNGGLTMQHQIFRNTSYQLSYQGASTYRTYLDGPAGPGPFQPASPTRSSYEGFTNALQAHVEQQAGPFGRILLGYDYERERYVNLNGTYDAPSSTGSVRFRQRSNAFYFQDQVGFLDSRLQVTLGGRAQYFNLKVPRFLGFDSPYEGIDETIPPTAYTGDASVAYFFNSKGTKIRGHVGNSFRAPSGYERFSGDSGFYYGDPTLHPERAVAFDVGVDQRLLNSKLTVSGTLFYTNLQETIIFANSLPADDPYARTFGYQNGGGGIARGLEFSGHFSPNAQTNIGASYTYVNSDSKTPTIGTDYYKSLGKSPHAFTSTVTRWIGRHSNVSMDMSVYSKYTIKLSGAGDRQFVFAAPVKVDAVYRYEFPLANHRSTELYVKLENLLNQRPYENGFIGPKEWAVVGIRLKY